MAVVEEGNGLYELRLSITAPLACVYNQRQAMLALLPKQYADN